MIHSLGKLYFQVGLISITTIPPKLLCTRAKFLNQFKSLWFSDDFPTCTDVGDVKTCLRWWRWDIIKNLRTSLCKFVWLLLWDHIWCIPVLSNWEILISWRPLLLLREGSFLLGFLFFLFAMRGNYMVKNMKLLLDHYLISSGWNTDFLLNGDKRLIMNSGDWIWFKFSSNWELTDIESFKGCHEFKAQSAN